tara:strand:- start:4165 stop:4743 length:579 start_codon:yes stop_codon:yes gene_type:complete
MKAIRISDDIMWEDELVRLFNILSLSSADKNRDWFGRLANNYKQYEEWYVCVDKNSIVAFSGVVKIGNYYRLLSRLWYDEDYRVDGLTTPLHTITPAMMMAELMLEDFTENLFCSMEYPQRRKHLEKVAERLNFRFGRKFKLNHDMHRTCDDDTFSCWQNTISEVELDLPSMSVKEWRLRFGNSRKMPDRKN